MSKHIQSDLLIGQHASAGYRESQPAKPNYDSFAVKSFQISSDQLEVMTLAIVTHGLGDPKADSPKIAADLTVATLIEAFDQAASQDIVSLLSQGFHLASQRIADSFNTVGVTCSAAVVTNCQLYVASCGNCRIILVRDHHARQVAVAHAMGDMLVERGILTWDQIAHHPFDPPPTSMALGNLVDIPMIDLRLRLTEDETDSHSLKNQGTTLLPNDRIVLLSSGGFGNSIVPELSMTIEAAFSDLQLTSQETVDRFVEQIRQHNTYCDLAVVLLQIPTLSKHDTSVLQGN